MDLLNTTIARIFRERVLENGDRVLAKYSESGEWKELTWTEYGHRVDCIASALLEMGVKKGEGICVMSSTRVEWGIIDLAVLSIGGITGAIYPTLLGGDTSYIINDMKAPVVFCESAVQRDIILSRKEVMPQLRTIVVINNDAGSDPLCQSLQVLIENGENSLGRHKEEIIKRTDNLRPDDEATVIYTSGTTGTPKGAVHDHRSIVYTASNNVYPFEPGMLDLSYLPMAHVFERFGGFFGSILMGNVAIGYFRGDMKGVVADFQQLKPNCNRTAPRLLEKMYSIIMSMMEAKSEEEKKEFFKAYKILKAVRVDEALYGRKADSATRKAYEELNEKDPLVMVRQILGGNMKFFYGGGAPIPKEVTEFFFAAGIPVYELYGTTETIGTVTNYPGKVKAGSIGVPFPMTGWPGEPGETRLAADGEIENRGPNVMKRYLNQPELTRESFTDDGWFKTGDIGSMDEEGFITITDRKKDIIITAGGKNIAPQRIENYLKETGFFSQVMVYGDKKKYLTALVTLDPMAVPALSAKLGIVLPPEMSEEEKYGTVARDQRTFDFVKSLVDERNLKLFQQERIVKFLLLDRDLNIELDEITPTMKLKKRNVVQRFKAELDALYGE